MSEAPRRDGVLAQVAWGLRVLRQYVRIGFIRKSQFRLEFLNQVLMDVCFYLSFVFTFEILYGLGGDGDQALSLGGWTHAEMRVYLGMVFVSDALIMTFLGQNWHFGQDLKNGALDPFKVRPGPPAFTYFFQRFSPEGLTNLVIAGGWLAFALAGVVPGSIDVGHVLLTLPLAIAVVAWSQVFLILAYNLGEFWLLHSDIGHLASMFVSTFGERPLDVYPRGRARVLTFVVPVAGIAWFPASLVLGRLDPLFVALYPFVLVVFAALVARAFRRGMRRYESAMS
ncbi:MAG: ABC-2 family transporter protein [Planctomycetota bacterium]